MQIRSRKQLDKFHSNNWNDQIMILSRGRVREWKRKNFEIKLKEEKNHASRHEKVSNI